ESLQKQLEAAERRSAKAVDRLVVVADRDDVARPGGQQLEQPQLRDVGILKFVDQDVPVACLQAFAQHRVALQQFHGLDDQSVQGSDLLSAEQVFPGPIGPRNLQLSLQLFEPLAVGFVVHLRAFRFQLLKKRVDIAREVFGGDELILAAREE